MLLVINTYFSLVVFPEVDYVLYLIFYKLRMARLLTFVCLLVYLVKLLQQLIVLFHLFLDLQLTISYLSKSIYNSRIHLSWIVFILYEYLWPYPFWFGVLLCDFFLVKYFDSPLGPFRLVLVNRRALFCSSLLSS